MNLFRTVIGIDPSGKRLVLAAVRGGFGQAALCLPPFLTDLRGDREPQLLSEAEEALGEFVARNALAGSEATLCIPADRVYIACLPFPLIREKDLRPALELELERLFPFPQSRLRFGWRTLGKASDGKTVKLVVTAVLSDYIDSWENAVSRVGLRFAGAVPAGCALSSALALAGRGGKAAGGITAILRDAGEVVECSVLSGGVPVFSASRKSAPDAMPAEGRSLLEEGLMNVPSAAEEAPVELVAPSEWCDGWGGEAGPNDAVRFAGDFPHFPVSPTTGPVDAEKTVFGRAVAGAFGAAVAEKTADLAEPGMEGAASRIARISALILAGAALLLGIAWPATHYWRAKAELSRIDAEMTALKPIVAEVEDAVAALNLVESRLSLLRAEAASRGEPLLVLSELTDRLPDGTWLTGLRVEDRKVEMDGLSPSANELFPLLTRDGRFRDVAFASPITRQADNLERFRIRAEFVPGRGARKEPVR
jgi:hypothetical protein